MKMNETIEFLLKNRTSLNPAVLKTVLSSIEPDTIEEEEEEEETIESINPVEPTPETQA